jgi:4-hydroxy-tetrahydrodipicolinate synthase
VLSGDDFTVLPTLAIGGHGVISVVSNVAPGLVRKMCKAFRKGDLAKARKLHYRLAPLCRAMFMETNPIPAKTALGLMGRFSPELRLPLINMTPGNEAKLAEVLKASGLL